MKSNEYWALYNCSTLWCVEKTQAACKEYAAKATGRSWKEGKVIFDIVKVTVIRNSVIEEAVPVLNEARKLHGYHANHGL